MSTVKRSASHSSGDEDSEHRKGSWTLEEDSRLIHYIARHGEGRWNMLAKLAGLKRTGKSCRLRWLNYLRPDIKRGNLSPHEQLLILELHSKWGNRWSKIAQYLPGRTDNEIKNYWRTRVHKQARQLNVESGTERFLDVMRCFWMPRLLQKMGQSSSSGSCSSTAIASENLPDFSMLTNSVAPTLPPSLPQPITSVDFQHNGNTNTGFSKLNVSWTDSMNIGQPPDLEEWPCSHSKITDVSNAVACNSNSINNSCFVDINSYESYDMSGLNFDPISAVETNDMSQLGYHIAESNDLLLDDMVDALWNMNAM